MNEFLHTHARIRITDLTQRETAIERTLSFANQLTGEPIALESRMTELSGGQTRALLIADATIICNTPIVLLDEVEMRASIVRARSNYCGSTARFSSSSRTIRALPCCPTIAS